MSLIARLITAGVDADLIEEVAMLLAEKKAIERTLSEKKELARDRQARKRERERTATSRDVPQHHVTERDERDERDDEVSPALSLPPNDINSNPPTHTHPDIHPAHEAEPASAPTFGPQDVVDLWNNAAPSLGLSRVAKLSDARRSHAKRLIREHGSQAFTEAIAAISRSSFLLGDNRSGWKADFDFLLQPSSFLKLIEGSYDRNNNRNGQASGGAASGNRSARVQSDGLTNAINDALADARSEYASSPPGRYDDGYAPGDQDLKPAKVRML